MSRLPHHRFHDCAHLIARWRRVARDAGATMRVFAQAGALQLHVIETRAALGGDPVCYLSAGVHGDEPAAAAGLIAWAEQNIALLRHAAFLIFPCLNPHGLKMNERCDARGLDLNRRFHLRDDEVCGAWHREMEGRVMLTRKNHTIERDRRGSVV